MTTFLSKEETPEITELYNGAVVIEFRPKSHKYAVTVNGVKHKPVSVTRITSIVDKSGPISGWSINNTVAAVRERIHPNTEYTREELEAIFAQAKRSSYAKKEEASTTGKMAHAWISNYSLTGQEAPLSKDAPHRPCVEAAMDWFDKHKVEFLESERAIYSIRHNYSGRMDGIAVVNGVLSLIDYKSWKSGTIVYPEARFQVAGYQAAYEEETKKIITQRCIIKLEKDTGAFDCNIYPRDTYRKDFKGFLSAMVLFQTVHELEKQEKNKVASWVEELDAID